MKKTLFVIVLTFVSTGCTGLVGESAFVGENEGRFLLSADGRGMETFGEALNGLVTTGKASPDVQDAYWNTRQVSIKARQFKVTQSKKSK